jgi:hypothetical protein
MSVPLRSILPMTRRLAVYGVYQSVDRCKYSGVIRGLLCYNCLNGLRQAYYHPLILRASAAYLDAARTMAIPRWRTAWRESWASDPQPAQQRRLKATGEQEQWCPRCKVYKLVQDDFRRKRSAHCRHPAWCDLCLYFDHIDTEYDLTDASYEALLQSQRYGCIFVASSAQCIGCCPSITIIRLKG